MEIRNEKPCFEEFYFYSKKWITSYLNCKKFSKTPADHKDEALSRALFRAFEIFNKNDIHFDSWKAYIQKSCRGAISDYFKDISKESLFNESFESSKIVFESIDLENHLNPNWELLSRLSSKDEDLHILCKVLLGYKQHKICSMLPVKISRERLSQRISDFLSKFEDPSYINSPLVNQYIFALDLSERFHMKKVDNGIGWDFLRINLRDDNSFILAKDYYSNLEFKF